MIGFRISFDDEHSADIRAGGYDRSVHSSLVEVSNGKMDVDFQEFPDRGDGDDYDEASFLELDHDLLDSVKKNPQDAIRLCNKFKKFNAKGISASSDKAIDFVSNYYNLNEIRAEILSIYVIGLHCPHVT